MSGAAVGLGARAARLALEHISVLQQAVEHASIAPSLRKIAEVFRTVDS
jgi:hypothetical protein